MNRSASCTLPISVSCCHANSREMHHDGWVSFRAYIHACTPVAMKLKQLRPATADGKQTRRTFTADGKQTRTVLLHDLLLLRARDPTDNTWTCQKQMLTCLSPLYLGSASRASLLVPTSTQIGRQWEGLTPAAAVYSWILPSLMPMPLQPRSPSLQSKRNRLLQLLPYLLSRSPATQLCHARALPTLCHKNVWALPTGCSCRQTPLITNRLA